jgi:hypothetical protein
MIYSDCEAAVKSINNLSLGRKRLRATTRDASMLSAAALLLKDQETLVRWTKGHPEGVDKDADNWSTEMWGNHLADRSAAGTFLGDMNYQYDGLDSNLLFIQSFPTLDALDLSSRLAIGGSWLLGNSRGQLRTESIMEAVQSSRLQQYITTRDSYRTARGVNPKWHRFDIRLAAEIWQMKTQHHSRTLRNRLLFDKHWHGGNKIKDKNSTTADGKCPFCIEADSAGHWMVYCQMSPRAVDIRKDMFSEIRVSVRLFAEDKGQFKPSVESLADVYIDLLRGRDAPDIWRGLWTTGKLESFGSEASDQYFPDEKVRILRKVFFLIGKIVTDAVIRIWQARQLTEFELVKYMEEHPNINYVPPAHVTYPNIELPTLSEEQLEELVQSATALPPEPIVKRSLYNTSRKLSAAVSAVAPTNLLTEEPESRQLVELHPPPEKRTKYPKHKPMSTQHRFQNSDGKKKAQHYKEKRRAPIPIAGTPSIWNYCPGNPQCVVPPRSTAPTATPILLPRKTRSMVKMTYNMSESGIFNTLIPEYSSANVTTNNEHIDQNTSSRTRSVAKPTQQGMVRTVEDPVLTFDPG